MALQRHRGDLLLGVVFTAVALWQLGERLDNGSGHIAPLFLGRMRDLLRHRLYCPLRAGVALFLLALGNWFSAETGYVSGWAPTGWA